MNGLWYRDDKPLSSGDRFLQLIQNPFKSDVQHSPPMLISANLNQQFQVNALWASLGTSIGLTLLLAALFSLFRPRHSQIYAPKVKHADHKHAPPPIGKGFFSWCKPILRTKEAALVDCIGLDATVFLRFTRMCRDIFTILSVIGCLVMIPLNISENVDNSLSGFSNMTPMNVSANAIWGQVACAWMFNIVIAFFLWRNYRAVRMLRRRYFESSDYQRSLHARTLMVSRRDCVGAAADL